MFVAPPPSHQCQIGIVWSLPSCLFVVRSIPRSFGNTLHESSLLHASNLLDSDSGDTSPLRRRQICEIGSPLFTLVLPCSSDRLQPPVLLASFRFSHYLPRFVLPSDPASPLQHPPTPSTFVVSARGSVQSTTALSLISGPSLQTVNNLFISLSTTDHHHLRRLHRSATIPTILPSSISSSLTFIFFLHFPPFFSCVFHKTLAGSCLFDFLFALSALDSIIDVATNRLQVIARQTELSRQIEEFG